MVEGGGCCFSLMASKVAVTFVLISLTLILIRVLYVIYWSGRPLQTKAPLDFSTLIVLGGHTVEMLNLLSVLQKKRFSPRFYFAAVTDNMSLEKARALENSLVEVRQQKFHF